MKGKFTNYNICGIIRVEFEVSQSKFFSDVRVIKKNSAALSTKFLFTSKNSTVMIKGADLTFMTLSKRKRGFFTWKKKEKNLTFASKRSQKERGKLS